MEPISLLAVGLSTLVAVSAKSLVAFFSKRLRPERSLEIDVVTKDGSKVRVLGANKLNAKQVQEIIRTLEVKTLKIEGSSRASAKTQDPPNPVGRADG